MLTVTGVQTCALPILHGLAGALRITRRELGVGTGGHRGDDPRDEKSDRSIKAREPGNLPNEYVDAGAQDRAQAVEGEVGEVERALETGLLGSCHAKRFRGGHDWCGMSKSESRTMGGFSLIVKLET